MRPLFHPQLVNGRFGDPSLYVEALFERSALLFDLGDISALAPRKIHRIDQIFVSHAHLDHLVGFDRLLRLLVGRERTVQLFGPPGFAERIHHKLQGYEWNLGCLYRFDVAFVVSEIVWPDLMRCTRFRLKNAFAPEDLGSRPLRDGVICNGSNYRISVALLDHRTPCLGFALQETEHVNVWKPRLIEHGLNVGPWLKELKRAFVDNRSDDFPIQVDGPGAPADRVLPLGELRDVLTVATGQKLAYVTDVADTAANRAAITSLARGADVLFIEAAFAAADSELAAERAHLTTSAAGEIARQAGVRRVEPFHFSARYAGEEPRMLAEASAAFAGDTA
jgi:ribonuclease Z